MDDEVHTAVIRFDGSFNSIRENATIGGQFEKYLKPLYGTMKVNQIVHNFLEKEKIDEAKSVAKNEVELKVLEFLSFLLSQEIPKQQ